MLYCGDRDPPACGHGSPTCKVTGPRGQGVPRQHIRQQVMDNLPEESAPRAKGAEGAQRWPGPLPSRRGSTQVHIGASSHSERPCRETGAQAAWLRLRSGDVKHQREGLLAEPNTGASSARQGPRGLEAALHGDQSQHRVPEGLAANAVRGTPEPPPDTARTETKQALNQASTR